jgi:hypothetical protein
MANELTTAETVEWEGLLARNARGKIEPGSASERRLRALTLAAEGKGRELLDAKEPVRAMTRQEAMAFYGIGQRCWYELSALGRNASDPVPWDNPELMPEWFARMRTTGGRKHPPPGKILLRADEARLGKARGSQAADPSPVASAPAPAAPAVPLILGEAATTDQILDRYMRIAAALGARYEEAAAAGEIETARTFRAEMDTVTDRIRQWSINAPKLREAEQWVRPDQFAATVRDFAVRLWRLLREQLTQGLPDDLQAHVNAALDRFAADLPALVPSELLQPCPPVAK